jgi:hypothetical protein
MTRLVFIVPALAASLRGFSVRALRGTYFLAHIIVIVLILTTRFLPT